MLTGWLRVAASAVIVVSATGCELLLPPDARPSSTPEIQVIIGVGADHVVQTKPLVEILPEVGANAADIAVSFPSIQQGGLGIEGGILFLSAIDGDGRTVLDRIIEFGGGLQALDTGEYTLIGYYRSCDANCSLLDPAVEFCRVDEKVGANTRYRLTVAAKSCVFEEAEEAS